MRSAPLLVVTAVLAASVDAHAFASLSGSITRVDAGTCRVQFTGCGGAETCEYQPPEDASVSCDYPVVAFAMSGAFGVPRNPVPVDASHLGDGGIHWSGPVIGWSHCFEGVFDFAVTTGTPPLLTLAWQIATEGRCTWFYPGGPDNHFNCGADLSGGISHVAVPDRIGDSAPLQAVVSVEPTTWTAAKRLYR
jgi:hypothetical protein